jgi:MraZ protein
MLNVRCQVEASLDDKARLALPAPLRRAIEAHGASTLVLTFHKGAILGYTAKDFSDRVERPLAERDQFDDEVRDFVHSILSPAQDIDLDGQGRIRIPQTLRDLAGVQKDVVVHSVLDRLEIWDAATWKGRFSKALERVGSQSGMPGRSP